MNTFATIDGLKSLLDHNRPLASAIVSNLREDLIVRWTYHSNAIEGNTLTLREIKVALEGITIGGNPQPLLALIAGIVKDSFQPYWHALKIQAPEVNPS